MAFRFFTANQSELAIDRQVVILCEDGQSESLFYSWVIIGGKDGGVFWRGELSFAQYSTRFVDFVA